MTAIILLGAFIGTALGVLYLYLNKGSPAKNKKQ